MCARCKIFDGRIHRLKVSRTHQCLCLAERAVSHGSIPRIRSRARVGRTAKETKYRVIVRNTCAGTRWSWRDAGAPRATLRGY